MGVFFELLRSEHEKIREQLATLRATRLAAEKSGNIPVAELDRQLNSLKHLVGTIHHAKEEELLFPYIRDSGMLEKGGPRCTEFAQIRLERDPTGAILSRAPGFRLEIGVPSDHFLSIPLEEHAAGHLALEILKRLLPEAQNSAPRRDELFSLMRDYEFLMDVHIRKEDECLFVLADESMGARLQEEMLKRARCMDKEP